MKERVGILPVATATTVTAVAGTKTTTTTSSVAAPTTTTGNEALSASGSGNDAAAAAAASQERKRCQTGGQQQQQQQQRYHHANGPTNSNNWRQKNSTKCKNQPWKNIRRNNLYNNNNNHTNNRNNYCSNQYYPHRNNWNQLPNYRRDQEDQNWQAREYRDKRTDYYRNPSAHRSEFSVGENSERGTRKEREGPRYSFRSSSFTLTRICENSRTKQSEVQNKASDPERDPERESQTDRRSAEKIAKGDQRVEDTSTSKPLRNRKEEETSKKPKEQTKNNSCEQIKEKTEQNKIEIKSRTKKQTEDNLKTKLRKESEEKEQTKNIKESEKESANKLSTLRTSSKESIEAGSSGSSGTKEPKKIEAVNQAYPKIQVRPLNELLKQEIIAVTQEHLLASKKSSSFRHLPLPAIQLRRRTVSSSVNSVSSSVYSNGECSISERLASLDKESLKHIINNSDTIYNEHLKLQARRRLREEIRRQLRDIELEQPKDTPAKQLIEDEIVDAIKLPQLLLQEIEKCFGIDISGPEASERSESPTQRTQEDQSEPNMAKENGTTDLMQRLKVAEQFKALAGKRCNQINRSSGLVQKKRAGIKVMSARKDKPKDTPAELQQPLDIKQEFPTQPAPVVHKTSAVIVLSSSEDEDEAELKAKPAGEAKEEDAGSDHSGSSSCSSESSKRRQQQKLLSDASNIVDSFEKLILPQLKDSLAERYRSSHCNSQQSRLHFISCVVTSSEHNSHSFTKIEVAKIQQNLKANDNRLAIEFLLREIVNVVNQQKQAAAAARRKQQLEKGQQQQPQQQQQQQSQQQPQQQQPQQQQSQSQQSQLQLSSNELNVASPSPGLGETKSAELASGAHQSGQSLMPPTPPRNGTPTRPLHALPLGLAFGGASEATMSRLSPGGFSPGEPMSLMLMGESVTHSLLEIDRRLLENQNRRGFLEEMIMKFQREKSDLELLSLELQNRKFLLLNTVIARNHTRTNTPPSTVTPTNSPPPPPPPPPTALVAPQTVAQLEGSRRKLRKRRAVVVKRVKILTKRKRPAKRSQAPQPAQPTVEQPEQEEEAIILPQPITMTTVIKEEPVEPVESSEPAEPGLPALPAESPTKRSTNLTGAGDSPKRQRLTRSAAAQQVLAIIPPLPPPPPPPEPIANMSYELPRVLLKPSPAAGHTPMTANMESMKYGFIPLGRLHSITSPITQIRIYKVYIIAASENGDVFMFNIATHKLERQITKHSEAITNMFLCEKESCLYTTSLDGFLKKSSLENLERVMQTVYLKEPLQSIDIEWGIAFIGSRWGNIFTYNIATNKVMDTPLLSTGQSIIAVKAAKEGVRKIILLGCKGNFVFLHDAATGLLLRRLIVPEGLNVYSLLLIDGHVFCGTQKNEVFKFDFATGSMTQTLRCGNGAVSMATYEDRYLLVGCYDGFIYVLNKETGSQLGRFSGPGRLVLALAIAGDRVVTSSKDNSLEILEIPSQLLNMDQET